MPVDTIRERPDPYPGQHQAASLAQEDLCPITLVAVSQLHRPYTASDGRTYEQESLKAWLKIRQVSPATTCSMKTDFERLFPRARVKKSLGVAVSGAAFALALYHLRPNGVCYRPVATFLSKSLQHFILAQSTHNHAVPADITRMRHEATTFSCLPALGCIVGLAWVGALLIDLEDMEER